MMKTPEERIIERINKEIGSDIKNLHKSEYLVKEYEESLRDIRAKVIPPRFTILPRKSSSMSAFSSPWRILL